MAKNMKAAAVAAGSMALAGLLGAAAVRVQRKHCLQILRTRDGIARVHVVEAEDGEQVRALSLGGVFQSATYVDDRRFEPVFAYYRAFDALFLAEPALGHPVRHVLMLGGGGFAYPKHLLTTRAGIRMDAVELDPGIVRAARRWFFLDELEARLADPARANGCALRVVVGDGRALLERAEGHVMPPAKLPAPSRLGFATDGAGGSLRPLREGELAVPRYDAIVNDAFSGREPVRSLATVEAARAARSRLAPGGVYLMNVVSRDGGRDVSFLQDEVATLLRVFSHVHVLPASDAAFGAEDNYLLVATDADTAFPEAIAYDADFPGTPLAD